jgi:NADPH:quinone reductase-like Zn-dependent oxidoreductase
MDNSLATGVLAGAFEHRYPLVLGRDVSGVVEKLGEGITSLEVGAEVIGHVGFEAPFQHGVLTDLAVLPVTAVVPKPETVDHHAAASLPLAGGAALVAVDGADVQPGQVVLVNGASGGVGRYAIQLLADRGATVVATGSAEDEAALSDLGAALVVDYTRHAVADQVLEAYPHGVDALVNLHGETDDDVPLKAVRAGGVVSTIRPVPEADVVAAHGLQGGGIRIASPDAGVLTVLAEHAAAGTLRTDIHQVLPLEQAVDGLEAIAAGAARGKIVVDLDL